jgi:hypothetical protein
MKKDKIYNNKKSSAENLLFNIIIMIKFGLARKIWHKIIICLLGEIYGFQ